MPRKKNTDDDTKSPAPAKTKASAKPMPEPKRITLTLPVRLTSTRRAVLGEELAQLNGRHRELQAQKKDAAKKFAAQISAVEMRSVPIEEALKMRGEKVVPLQVACEARPVEGQPNKLDIFRMDTDPPTYVQRIDAPTRGEQMSIPGVDPSDGAPDPEELERQFADDVARALGEVPYPEEDEETGDAGADDASASGADDTDEGTADDTPPVPPAADQPEDEEDIYS